MESSKVLIKTLLNKIHKLKGFNYSNVNFNEEKSQTTIEIDIKPRKGSRPICSGCGKPNSGYDTLQPRRFEFIPIWGIAVYLVYSMRRVNCPTCGVKVEQVPWATGKHRLTTVYSSFLAHWAQKMSWAEVARSFNTTWDHVFSAVEEAVEWGRNQMDLSGITAIGVDEIYTFNHSFVTLV
jgi:transposase